jgi:hypothetical protein
MAMSPSTSASAHWGKPLSASASTCASAYGEKLAAVSPSSSASARRFRRSTLRLGRAITATPHLMSMAGASREACDGRGSGRHGAPRRTPPTLSLHRLPTELDDRCFNCVSYSHHRADHTHLTRCLHCCGFHHLA